MILNDNVVPLYVSLQLFRRHVEQGHTHWYYYYNAAIRGIVFLDRALLPAEWAKWDELTGKCALLGSEAEVGAGDAILQG